MLEKQRRDPDQVLLRVDRVCSAGIHAQQTGLHVRAEVNSYRSEIAPDPLAAFVKTHEQRSLAAPTGGFSQQSRQSRLGSAGRTRDQGAAAAEQAAAQHRVKPPESR